jgi:hypothetical protein
MTALKKSYGLHFISPNVNSALRKYLIMKDMTSILNFFYMKKAHIVSQ